MKKLLAAIAACVLGAGLLTSVAGADSAEADYVDIEGNVISVPAGEPFSVDAHLFVRRAGTAVTEVTWATPTVHNGDCTGISASGAQPATLTMPDGWSALQNQTRSIDRKSDGSLASDPSEGVASGITISGQAGADNGHCTFEYGSGATNPGVVRVRVNFVEASTPNPCDSVAAPAAPTFVHAPDGENGWYRTIPTVSATSADGTVTYGPISGGPYGVAPTLSDGQTTVYGVATEPVCEKVSTESSQLYKVDTTAPDVTVTGVLHGATYYSAPSPGCSTADSTSGVQDHATLGTTGGPLGLVTATCSGAKDNAGNTAAPVSATYTVLALGGLNSNFDGSGVLTAKSGSAIPLRWAITDGTSNLDVLSHIKVNVASAGNGTCADGGLEHADLADQVGVASGKSDLQRLPDGSYQFNLKSIKGETGCKRVTVRMYDDPDAPDASPVITRSVLINFTR